MKITLFPGFLPASAARPGTLQVGTPLLLLQQEEEHTKLQEDKLSKASSPPAFLHT